MSLFTQQVVVKDLLSRVRIISCSLDLSDTLDLKFGPREFYSFTRLLDGEVKPLRRGLIRAKSRNGNKLTDPWWLLIDFHHLVFVAQGAGHRLFDLFVVLSLCTDTGTRHLSINMLLSATCLDSGRTR